MEVKTIKITDSARNFVKKYLTIINERVILGAYSK